MGAWSQLFEVFNPALSSLQTFLQAIAVLGAGCFAAYYKIREMFAGPQEDQMYSQKTKGVFIGLIFVFIIPVLINIFKTLQIYERLILNKEGCGFSLLSFLRFIGQIILLFYKS